MNPRPSLTVICDPDTGKPINQGANAPTGYLSRVTRLGSMFTDPAPAAVATAGPASPPVAKVDPDDVAALKLEIRRLKSLVDSQPDAKAAEALADLHRIRDAEYARPDGGRLPVKRALAGAGIRKED